LIEFLLDEHGFQKAAGQWPAQPEILKKFVSTLEAVQVDAGQGVKASSDFYSAPISPSTDIWAFVFPQVQPDRDFWRRLEISLGRVTFDIEAPATSDCQVGGTALAVSSRAIGHGVARRLDSRSYPVVVSHGFDPQEISCRYSEREASLFFVSDATHLALCFRSFLRTHSRDETMRPYFDLAFPNLFICPKATVKSLGFKFRESLPHFIDHLSWLSDDFLNVAAENQWDMPKMMLAAKIAFSDESRGTKADRKEMAEREVVIADQTVCCSLHTKLRPTKGRIHFRPPVEGLALDRIIVGLTADHRST